MNLLITVFLNLCTYISRTNHETQQNDYVRHLNGICIDFAIINHPVIFIVIL